MADFTSDLGWTTGGLFSGDNTTFGNGQTLATGSPTVFGNSDVLNPIQVSNSASVAAATTPVLAQSSLAYTPSNVFDSYGNLFTSGSSALNLSSNSQLTFNPTTLQGIIQSNGKGSTLPSAYGHSMNSFTGSDVKVMIQISNSTGATVMKRLTELHTLSISVHREKAAARALGYINPKGFGRGTRTIAGTLILTPASVDVMYELLAPAMQVNLSKDSVYSKVDQIPPIDVTIFFANEAGYASYRQIIGMEFITDGEIYSVNDLFVERTISYIANDFTPLVPVTTSSIFQNPYTNSPVTSKELSPTDIFNNYSASPGSSSAQYTMS